MEVEHTPSVTRAAIHRSRVFEMLAPDAARTASGDPPATTRPISPIHPIEITGPDAESCDVEASNAGGQR